MADRLAIPALLLATACAADPTPATARRFVDSLGVQVVEHPSGAFDRAPQWTIDPAPVVVYDPGTDVEFDLTNAMSAIRLSDRRLAVTSTRHGENGRLLLFDASGRPARQLARTGNGPGELMNPRGTVLLPGDTVAVIDFANDQLNLYTADAGFVRGMRLDGRTGEYLAPIGALPDDRLLFAIAWGGGSGTPPGRALVAIIHTALDLTEPDTVALLPGTEHVPFAPTGARPGSTIMLRLGPQLVASTWDKGIATANGDGGYVVERRTPAGVVELRILVDQPRRAVTEEMWSQFIDRLLESVPAQHRDGTRRIAIAEPHADSLPPYERLLPAPDGTLWVTDFVLPADSAWVAIAFSRDGEIVARLTVPNRGVPVSFDRDHVMVRETDADGVVRFALYRVRRPT